MTPAAGANLIATALDLQLVRLLRSAMQPKLRPAPAVCPPGRPAIVKRLKPDPMPLAQAPAARRPAHILYRTEIKPVLVPVAVPASASDEAAAPGRSRIQPPPPPWKQPAWEKPLEPPPVIKVIIHRPDIISKGSLIDFFM